MEVAVGKTHTTVILSVLWHCGLHFFSFMPHRFALVSRTGKSGVFFQLLDIRSCHLIVDAVMNQLVNISLDWSRLFTDTPEQ